MANLKVSIVVRTKGPDGKRGWVPATGKNDPAGPLYLRYYAGSCQKHSKAGRFYDEAEVAKLRLERKLKASSMGFEVPEEHEKGKDLHHWGDCLNSYITHLRRKRKRNGWKYADKSVREREANILEFARLINKPFVESYTSADMLRYKEHLYGLGRRNHTVLNKLSCIVTWLKRNGLVSIIGLLPADERPERREPEGHPFTRAEVDKMMEVAGEHKSLLRLALNSGMRKMELAHAERSDIDPINKTIRVSEKPKYGWVPKTKRGLRAIPLGDGLVRDLLVRPDGLLFPNTEDHPGIRIDRIFEEIGKSAGVQARINSRADWVHRWRDTTATRQLEAGILRDRDLNRYMGWEGQGNNHSPMVEHYARYSPFDSPEVRKAANLLDPYREKAGLRIVRKSA
jgi:integrase